MRAERKGLIRRIFCCVRRELLQLISVERAAGSLEILLAALERGDIKAQVGQELALTHLLWRKARTMTKLIGKGPVSLVRILLLCSPALALGACAAPPPPPPCDACAAAAQAQQTANQALTVAHQALAAANAARAASSEMYQRSLRK
jgi:hypothetical protein